MSAARHITDHLEHGQEVPPGSLDFARQVMIRQMGKEGSKGAVGSLATDLHRLLNHEPSAEHRGQVLGSVLALGSQGEGALANLLDTSGGDLFRGLLSAAERGDLMRLAQNSVRERLAHLAQMLEESSSKPARPHQDDPPEPLSNPFPIVADRPRPTNPLDEQFEDGLEPPLPDEQLEANLRNTSASEETRVTAALRMGRSAMPILEAMAADPAQREVALSALVLLGEDREHARTVRDTAINLEVHHDLETKVAGRMLRSSLEGVPSAPSDEGKDLSSAGGWLQRSLDLCSAPSILMASAGRESLAIPLTMRRLLQVRSVRAVN